MKQIYTNTTERIYLRVYKDGVPANASSGPNYSISVVGSGDAPATGTATLEETGVYFFVTDLSYTEMQGILKVDWTYEVTGDPGARTDYISVVTPYVSFMELKGMYPDQTDAEVENAELFSRFMINAYTGQEFALKGQTITMFGNNKATLVLPYRIDRLDSISVNDEELWTRDPAVNELGRTISITDTNYGLLSEKYDNVPTWSDFNERAVWKKSYKYTLEGLWGWSNIPDEVEYAAKILADDYFCRETAWKKRYVEQINASDWRVVFNQKQFQGTGNFFVDQILSKYRSIGMVLV